MELPHAAKLRAGYVAVRRDATSLQVGLDAPGRAILPDTAAVRAMLAGLEQGLTRLPESMEARRALTALADADLLEHQPSPTVDGGVGLDACEELRSVVAPLLRAAGLRLCPDASLTLVADDGPTPRHRLDRLMREGRPHLLVAGGPRGWTVGPFVRPGTTACVRCVDAHHALEDPRRPLVLDQLSRVPRAKQVVDPLLRLTALGLAVADLRAYAAGQTPVTWSATLTVGDGAPRLQEWRRHPHCGCGWDLLPVTP